MTSTGLSGVAFLAGLVGIGSWLFGKENGWHALGDALLVFGLGLPLSIIFYGLIFTGSQPSAAGAAGGFIGILVLLIPGLVVALVAIVAGYFARKKGKEQATESPATTIGV